MATTISSNFDYQGKLPDFTRQEYATISDMKAVKKARMPEMYIAYCLEDHKVYLYNKANENDEVYGYWREFNSGSSSESIQVVSLPAADETQAGKVYQYIGNSTLTEIKGYFYFCNSTEEVQVVDITTLADLKTTINESDVPFQVNTGSEMVDTKAFVFDNVYYYVNNDVVFSTTNTEGSTTDTPIETDEAVAALTLTKSVTVYSYNWEQLNVQPSQEQTDPIQVSELPEATAENLGTIYQYVGTTDVDENLVNGYFYKCIVSGTVGGINQYGWTKIDVNSRNLTVISVDEINNLFN